MRAMTLSDIAALVAAQALALVLGCASLYGVWLWPAVAQPFR